MYLKIRRKLPLVRLLSLLASMTISLPAPAHAGWEPWKNPVQILPVCWLPPYCEDDLGSSSGTSIPGGKWGYLFKAKVLCFDRFYKEVGDHIIKATHPTDRAKARAAVVEIYENARDGITPDLCWAGSTEWYMGRKLYWLFENGPNPILLNPEQVFPTQTLDENGNWTMER